MTISSITIEFKNMEARRVGKSIRTFRNRMKKSLEQFAKLIGIEVEYLNRLEEGYEPIVDLQILEAILQKVGVAKRGNKLTNKQIIDIFLYATQEQPPRLL